MAANAIGIVNSRDRTGSHVDDYGLPFPSILILQKIIAV